MLYDLRLTVYDKLVYVRLADCCWQGTTAKVGQRAISRDLGISRTQVCRSLARLEEFGHLVSTDMGVKRVQWYYLTSPVFGKKQRAGVKEVVVGPKGTRRMTSVEAVG